MIASNILCKSMKKYNNINKNNAKMLLSARDQTRNFKYFLVKMGSLA